MMTQVSVDIYPAWKNEVLEDWTLQEKACDRLVAYFNEGKAHRGTGTGQHPIKLQAEKIEIQRPKAGSVKFGLRLTLEVEVTIR